MTFRTSSAYDYLTRFFREHLFAEFSSRIYTYSLVIGLISGLAAAFFTWGLELARFVFLERLAGFQQFRPAGEVAFDFAFLGQPVYAHHTWVLALLPALGGLVSGYLVYRVAPEAEGHGTDAMIDAFHNRRGFIRPVVPAVKGAATILVLGSGGSAGKEGPVAQIGAGLGSWLATRLGLSAAQRRILLLAGTAGGLGAIFRAPLGGALTSVEVLYREDFESDALVPCVISSITAYSVYTGVFGFSPIFAIPDLSFRDARELLAYLVLGILCALAGILYVKIFYGIRDHFFRKLPLPKCLVVALGGLLVGLLGLHFVVVNQQGHLRGMVRLDDLELREDEVLRNLILVEDLVVEGVEWAKEKDDLHLVLQKLLNSEFDKLPVIRREGATRKVVGYVMYQDLLQVYDEEIQKLSRHE